MEEDGEDQQGQQRKVVRHHDDAERPNSEGHSEEQPPPSINPVVAGDHQTRPTAPSAPSLSPPLRRRQSRMEGERLASSSGAVGATRRTASADLARRRRSSVVRQLTLSSLFILLTFSSLSLSLHTHAHTQHAHTISLSLSLSLSIYLSCVVVQVRVLFRSVEDERSGPVRRAVRLVSPSLSPAALAALDNQEQEAISPTTKRPPVEPNLKTKGNPTASLCFLKGSLSQG